MPGEWGVMFVGGDQEAPRSEVGAIDHHVFWWDCDGGKAWADTPTPGDLAAE